MPPALGRTYFPVQACNPGSRPMAGTDLPGSACCSLPDCHQVG